MNVLTILNDGPYGTERSYNGLRLVLAMAKQQQATLRVFLMADAVWCAKAGQTTPDGYYNVERMLRGCSTKSVTIGACGTCMDVRGLAEADLIDGVRRSSMAELATWTAVADKVLVW
jgi:uncharacterized protein involved in oxidation of intracellular sulfur